MNVSGDLCGLRRRRQRPPSLRPCSVQGPLEAIYQRDVPMIIPLKILAFLCTIISVMLISAAGAQNLSGNEIKQLVSGQRIYLSTPFGVELPLVYQTNGAVVGNISGISVARMLTPRETGKWWVQGNVLCQKWPTWYSGRQFCFALRRIGPGQFSWLRDDGKSGTARIGE